MSMTGICLLPDLIGSLSGDTRHALLYEFFKVGSLAITPVFLFKFVVFLVVLFSVSGLVQKLLLTRVLKHLHIAESLKFALGRFATYFLVIAGLFIGLQSLGVNLSSLEIFGGAVGVGVGLGLQNVVSNFVAGLILLIEQPIRLGDRVEMKSTMGDVIKIAARSTWIRTNDNVVIIVPNNEFINNSVTNWTANDPNVRIHVPVGVGYGSDPEQVRALLLAEAVKHPDVLQEPKPIVLFMEYGDNSINFELLVWTATMTHIPGKLRSDLLFSMFKVFGQSGIELPFPQRDLHIRSSDVALFAPPVPPAQG